MRWATLPLCLNTTSNKKPTQTTSVALNTVDIGYKDNKQKILTNTSKRKFVLQKPINWKENNKIMINQHYTATKIYL